MGFSEAVQWWEKWQLRILVLTSVFVQCFLFFAGFLRKRSIPSWLRFLIWLAYLSSDAVAIYGLATLFNRPKKQEWVSMHQGSSAGLQVLWAPILLIHLGGQDCITAYNIEDNELWRRHVLTAVSQIAVAVYVFRKACPEHRIILVTGILLFIVGVLKCVCKPWDLKRVSINSLIDSSAGSEQNPPETVSSPDVYIRATTEYFQETQPSGAADQEDDEAEETRRPYDLFVDFAPPYSDRLSCLKATVRRNSDKAHALVRHGLSQTFDRLYTKESLAIYYDRRDNSLLEWIAVIRFTITASSIAGVLSQFIIMRHKEAYGHTDATITFILLGVILAQDYLFPWAMSSIRTIQRLDEGRRLHKVAQWPGQVAQYNLIGYLDRNRKHRLLRRLATVLVCKDYIDQLWCMKPSKSSRDITRLVHGYIAKGWTEHHMKDMATYRAFNDNRGHWTLKQEGCGSSLNWSLRRPFDESVLLWHLATDFCFHLTVVTHRSDGAAHRSRVMSNYMVYLLFVNPEMLITGARRSIFRAAYRNLKDMLKETPTLDGNGTTTNTLPPDNEKELAQRIIQQPRRDTVTQGSTIIHDAWTLAQELMELRSRHGEYKMWRVIQGVWVEMLCFSAGRCRGYLHAKSLGKGGEYLSYVWLLLLYMGMETLAEKMQRSEQQDDKATSNGGGANGTTAAPPSPVVPTAGHATATAAASPVSPRGDHIVR